MIQEMDTFTKIYFGTLLLGYLIFGDTPVLELHELYFK